MVLKPTTNERFWAKVDTSGDCWKWTASCNRKGYGQFRYDGRWKRAHRFSWELHNGAAIPVGLFVCHHCDNPACVRPDHLFLGTHEDNMRDMVEKGHGSGGRGPRTGERLASSPRGERHGAHKLMAKDVSRIRQMYAMGGWTQAALGRHFGVHTAQIGRIVRHENWRQATDVA